MAMRAWLAALITVQLCAHHMSARSAGAHFSMLGVTGTIEFEQPSAESPVTIVVALNGLDETEDRYMWHVHRFPMIYDGREASDWCLADHVGGHYNPFNVDTQSSDYSSRCNAMEPEACEVGDLSGKHGLLQVMAQGNNGPRSLRLQANDSHLTLFGTHSIVGRSMVLHKATPPSTAWVCATILPEGISASRRTVMARFQVGVTGFVLLQQERDNAAAETSILMDISYADGTRATSGHGYHVHDSPAAMDDMSVAGANRCQSTGLHYNPELVNYSATDYQSRCMADAAQCEVGDLSTRHGLLEVPSTGSSKVMVTDVRLPLSGAYSVVGRSLVIHVAGGSARLACATLYEIEAKTAVVTLRESSRVEFWQVSPLDPVRVSLDLAGVPDMVRAFSVHELPVPESSMAGEQICDLTGEVYQPLAPRPLRAGARTGDMFAAGALSDKFKTLDEVNTGNTRKKAQFWDSYLTLFGKASVVGRSVVLKMTDGTGHWDCGTVHDVRAGHHRVAAFNSLVGSRAVSGWVQLWQAVGAGPVEDTMVTVAVSHTESHTSTEGHAWHVHEAVVGSDTDSATGRCASTRGHWNPLNVCLTEEENCRYNTVCNDLHMDRCEVGDFKGKHGPLSVQAAEYWLMVDNVQGGAVVIGSPALRQNNNQRFGTVVSLGHLRGASGDVVRLGTAYGVAPPKNGTVVALGNSTATVVWVRVAGIRPVLQVTDTNLPLAGLGSVGGSGNQQKSLVIHNAGGAADRLGCADLVDFEQGMVTCYGERASCTACHAECDFGGCSGAGADKCSGGCRHLRIASTGACVGICPAGLVQAGRLCVSAPKDGRQVEVHLNSAGISGVIVFTQNGPAAGRVQVYQVGLQLPPGAYRWYVAELPVVFGLDGTSACNHVGDVLDPSAARQTDSYTTHCNETSPWNCAAGDLGGQLGTVPAVGETKTLFDVNLLYGKHNIMGRALVIERTEVGSSWRACGAIGYANGAALETAMATFRYPVTGTITFRQMKGLAGTETSIFLELRRTDGQSTTEGHQWHVHENATGADDASERCGATMTGGHFNPLIADLDNYVPCSSGSDDKACEVGDLFAKHGPLVLAAGVGGVRRFYVDVQLPLTGSNSIVDRSIVIHSVGGGTARIACATVVPLLPRIVTASVAAERGLTGQIQIVQASIFDASVVAVDLIGLEGLAGGYHVHEISVPLDGNCGGTMGHYNPFGTPLQSDVVGHDRYEIGDLSGKHGILDEVAQSLRGLVRRDWLLPLFGPYSVQGRSLVVHRAADATRWACGDVGFAGPTVSAVAVFDNGLLTGEVTLTQLKDTPLAETTVHTKLRYTDSQTAPSTGYEWHVHMNAVGTSGDCSSTGDHYNPLGVCLPAQSCVTAYEALCGEGTLQFGCESGDLSSKHGSLRLPSDKLFTDSGLTLLGPTTVVGRSIIVHATDAQKTRLACASIIWTDAEALVWASVVLSGPTVSDLLGKLQTFRRILTTLFLTLCECPLALVSVDIVSVLPLTALRRATPKTQVVYSVRHYLSQQGKIRRSIDAMAPSNILFVRLSADAAFSELESAVHSHSSLVDPSVAWSPTSSPPPPETSSSELDTGIVTSVASVASVFAIALVVFFCCRCRRQLAGKRTQNTADDGTEQMELNTVSQEDHFDSRGLSTAPLIDAHLTSTAQHSLVVQTKKVNASHCPTTMPEQKFLTGIDAIQDPSFEAADEAVVLESNYDFLASGSMLSAKSRFTAIEQRYIFSDGDLNSADDFDSAKPMSPHGSTPSQTTMQEQLKDKQQQQKSNKPKVSLIGVARPVEAAPFSVVYGLSTSERHEKRVTSETAPALSSASLIEKTEELDQMVEPEATHKSPVACRTSTVVFSKPMEATTPRGAAPPEPFTGRTTPTPSQVKSSLFTANSCSGENAAASAAASQQAVVPVLKGPCATLPTGVDESNKRPSHTVRQTAMAPPIGEHRRPETESLPINGASGGVSVPPK